MEDSTPPNGQTGNVRTQVGKWAMVPLWLVPLVSGRAIQVYCCLCRYADYGNGQTAVGRKRLAQDLGNVTLPTLDKAIDELVTVDALEVHHRFDEFGDRAPNLYIVKQAIPGGQISSATGSPNSLATDTEDLGTRVEVSNEPSTSAGVAKLDGPELTQVYEFWRLARDRSRANYDRISPKRRKLIRERLKEFTVEDLCTAINGVARDPWEERDAHDDITVIFRNREQVERFIEYADGKADHVPRKLTAYELAHSLDHLEEGDPDAA